MKFRKKKEKDGESTIWKYAKYAYVSLESGLAVSV